MNRKEPGLLVLGRALNEVVVLQHPDIHTDIRIQVAEISRNRVKLAIQAPQDVNIVREEILKRDGIFVRRTKGDDDVYTNNV